MARIPMSRVVIGLLAACCVPASVVLAQSVSEPALKAAFLYNFAKFTEWPPAGLSPSAPLKFCVADSPVADALEPTLAGRSIGAHPLVVARVALARGPIDELLRGCAVVYVTGLDPRRVTELIEALQGAPIFTVSDVRAFSEQGGIAYFFIEGERMRFGINTAAAERSHLHLSSQLLSLAQIVKDRSSQ
ncbi:MAG: YfiR family protein [Acidobacteriota bacterium]